MMVVFHCEFPPIMTFHLQALQPQFEPEDMRLREHEMQNICSFIARTARRALPGCLYISGPPGTGKTASVNVALRLLKESTSHKLKTNFVHCMSEGNTRALLCTLLGENHAAADASCDEQVPPHLPPDFRVPHFSDSFAAVPSSRAAFSAAAAAHRAG
jgi:hypothetical protein